MLPTDFGLYSILAGIHVSIEPGGGPHHPPILRVLGWMCISLMHWRTPSS